MPSYKQTRWRPGLAPGIKDRHHPLWSWLSPVPFSQSRYALMGPMTRLSLWLLSLSVLCWMLLRFEKPKKVEILQFVAGYEKNLLIPVNVAGVRFAETVQKLSEEKYLRPKEISVSPPNRVTAETLARKKSVGGDPAAKTRGDGLSEIEGLILEKKDDPQLVLHFFMTGSVNAKGPYLLPDNADSDSARDKRLYVLELLNFLKNRMPRDQVKVLVFDAEQEEPLWRFGMLENLFAESLGEIEDRIREVPNLVVVNSCGKGEFSWRFHEVGLSCFGYTLARALSGDATDFDRDGELDLGEIFRTVAREVPKWTRDLHQQRQEIMILPAGSGENILRQVRITQAGRNAYVPPPIDQLQDDAELREAWEQHHAFGSGANSPATLCPDIWDQYQRTLLRYEELRRVGDEKNAKEVKEKLGIFVGNIKTEASFRLASQSANLWMSNINSFELDPLKSQEIRAAATQLLQAPVPELESILSGLMARNDSQGKGGQDFKLAILRQVLQSGVNSPRADWEKLFRLCSLLGDGDKLRPMELQWLGIFLRDRPVRDETDNSLQMFLQSLKYSERASCGVGANEKVIQASERGAVFLQAEIMRIDQVRRLAQDRLLSTDSGVRAQAKTDLLKAQGEYDEVGNRAAGYSRSLNRHDRLMADMPFYTAWVAKKGRHRVGVTQTQKRNNDDTEVLELEALSSEAWDCLHESAENRHAAVRALKSGGNPREHLEQMVALTDRASGLFDKIRYRHLAHCRALAISNEFGEDESIDQVLQVPDIDIPLRMQIIKTRTPQRVLGIGNYEDADPEEKARINDLRYKFFRRKAKLCLAFIGKGVFDRTDFSPAVLPESYLESRLTYEDCLQDLNPNVGNHKADMIKVGDQVGMRLGLYQSLCDQILASANSTTKGRSALELASIAEHLDRLANVDRISPTEAGSIIRKCWISHFLVFQAERAWNEHLFNINEDASPYFKKAMDSMIRDAETSRIKPEGLAGVKELFKRDCRLGLQRVGLDLRGGKAPLAQGPGISGASGPAVSEKVHWTTEPSQILQLRVESTDGNKIPVGEIQVEVTQSKDLVQKVPADGNRWRVDTRVTGEGAAKVPAHFGVEYTCPLADAGQDPARAVEPRERDARVKATALFRGQRVSLEVPFGIHPTAPYARSVPVFGGMGTLALRASAEAVAQNGVAKGNIAILVDCSGSMGAAGDGPAKITQVAQALEHVIAKLPPGILFSVWVFGQAEGPARTMERPEEAIRVIAGPSVLGRDTKDVARRVADRFRNGDLVPWNKSPVLAAMVRAGRILTGPEAQAGPSTLLVLTDGVDNRAMEDRDINPEKAPIPALIGKYFGGAGIQVNVIGFRAGEEEDRIREDFGGVAKLDPPGSVLAASDLDGLISQMEKSLRREFLYQLETRENLPVVGMPRDGFPASLPGFADKWVLPGLEPGEYLVRSSRMRPPLGVARLEPGDALLLELNKEGAPQRVGLLADNTNRPSAPSGEWKAGVVYNRLASTHSTARLAVLEKAWNRRESEFLQVRPGIVWWECEPKGGGLHTTRVADEAGYPAPAWSIHSTWWPKSPDGAPRDATMTVWWHPGNSPIPFEELVKGQDFATATDLAGRPMDVDGEPWLLEGVTLEKRKVRDQSGAQVEKPVLVIRTRTKPPEKGKKAAGWPMPGLEGIRLQGREDFLYPEAGKMTTVFWPVDAASAGSISSIQFRSLGRFKQEAEENKRCIRLDSIGEPDPKDQMPRKALDGPGR